MVVNSVVAKLVHKNVSFSDTCVVGGGVKLVIPNMNPFTWEGWDGHPKSEVFHFFGEEGKMGQLGMKKRIFHLGGRMKKTHLSLWEGEDEKNSYLRF